MGARPLELCTDDAMIEHWLPSERARDDAAAAAAALSGLVGRLCPLASVRTLQLFVRSPSLFTPTNVVRLLRAAPHLEQLTIHASEVDVDASWLGHPAFDGLVHLKLKRVRVSGLGSLSPPATSDFLLRLRQRHFPRLRVVAIDGSEHFVTPLDPSSFDEHLFTRFANFIVGLVSRFWARRK
jgi:hypothetical protein